MRRRGGNGAEPLDHRTPWETFSNMVSATAEHIDVRGDGGILKRIVKHGDGEKLKQGKEAMVHYVGTLPNGEQFDSSRARDEPFIFTLGARQVR